MKILEKIEEKLGVVNEAVDSGAMIKILIDTNFSASDEEQGKASQLFKGLLLSDDPVAKKFIKDLDSALSKFDISKYK